MFRRLLSEDAGVLTFEWILLATLITIGLISGLAVVKSAWSVELTDVGQAAAGLNAAYDIKGIDYTTTKTSTASVTDAQTSYTAQTYRSYAYGTVDNPINVAAKAAQ